MIIYGTRSTQLAKETLMDKCPSCGAQNSVELYAFQKYAHIFWIPFFPIGKTAVSQCGHCKQVLQKKEMPENLLAAFQNLKAQTRMPIWTFSGLGLLAALVIAVVISDKKKDERNAKLILTPQSGDVFEIKTKENQYTLYKVSSIQNDSIIIHINNYETNKISGLADLKSKGESAYSEDEYAIHKSDLKQMLEKGEIVDIERGR